MKPSPLYLGSLVGAPSWAARRLAKQNITATAWPNKNMFVSLVPAEDDEGQECLLSLSQKSVR